MPAPRLTPLSVRALPVCTANIACVGLPGSGKSTIGRQLARRLGLRFFDSDYVIERRIACSIREFFEREGEQAFRDLEQDVIGELTLHRGCVLSTGGGVVLRPTNRENLHQRCQVVYLQSDPEEVFRRVRHDQNRARLKELYDQRDPLYRETAHFVVETGRPSVATLVNTIVTQLALAGVIASQG